MKDLRVLFLSIYRPFDIGSGPGTHLRYLSQELVKLGCEIHILTPECKIAQVLDGVQIHPFKSAVPLSTAQGISFSLFSVKKVNELCREYRIDLVHGQSPSSVGHAFFRRNRLPFITTLHSTSFGEILSSFKWSISDNFSSVFYNDVIVPSFWAFLISIECRRADKVIAVSKYLAREAMDFFHLPKDKVVAIHNGVNLPPNSPIEERNEEHMILFVGRLTRKKGIRYLLDALPRILTKYPDTKLLVAGEGECRNSLENYVKRHKIDKSADFLGVVPTRILYSLYAKASVVVQPSIYEACGLPILEAMSMGKPVIGTHVGGIPELIKNGEDGLLVQPGDSIKLADAVMTIFSNASYGRKLGIKAKQKVLKNFTWKVVARKTLDLYESLLEK